MLMIALGASAMAEDVSVANFVRAETDHMIRSGMKAFNIGVGKIVRLREPAD